jgi:hypothetical protein
VLQINVTAGETYIIFAAGDPFTFAAPSAADTQLLTVTATSLGARTDGAMTCATAEPLTLGTSGTFYPGLDNGWSDPSDPCSSCEVTDGTCLADGTLVGKEYRQGSRWWYYDAPLSGTLTVTVSAGPAFAQTLSVWTGPCGSLTEVACLIDQDPAVSFSVTAGTRYYLHLAGYACPAAPDLPLPLPTEPWLYDITLALAFPCGAQPNSTCATAVTLTGPRAAALQGLGTTDDPSTPCPSCAADCASLYAPCWFTWIAPEDGLFTVQTCLSVTDTLLSVWTGSCAALVEIGCSEDDCGVDYQSTVTFLASAGVRYYFLVTVYNPVTPGDQVLLQVLPEADTPFDAATLFALMGTAAYAATCLAVLGTTPGGDTCGWVPHAPTAGSGGSTLPGTVAPVVAPVLGAPAGAHGV